MLSQDDRERLAQIERQLAAEDPRFAARMGATERRRRTPLVIALVAFAGGLVAIAFLAGVLLAVSTALAVVAIELARRAVTSARPSSPRTPRWRVAWRRPLLRPPWRRRRA
ncbi:MAG TPA: DUF3040 domain-containing protein [Asanoa sp.]